MSIPVRIVEHTASSKTPMTLSDAQADFRRSPSRATALAYMDAAITYHEACGALDGAATLQKSCKEIRDWLMNERVP